MYRNLKKDIEFFLQEIDEATEVIMMFLNKETEMVTEDDVCHNLVRVKENIETIYLLLEESEMQNEKN